MLRESLKAPSTVNPTTFWQAGSKPKEPGSGAKEVETKTSVDYGRKEKVKDEEKPVMKTERPGDEKKVDAERDIRKPGERIAGSSDNTPAVTTDNTTNPVTHDVKVIPSAAATNKVNNPEVPFVAVGAAPGSDKKDDAIRKEVDPAIKDKEKSGKPEGSGEKTELIVPDEWGVTTPKPTTKELPTSPAKHLKEKAVPALGLTVPKTPRKISDPLSVVTVTGSTLSPLQKVLESTEDETLMERMARLSVVDANYQPPKDVVPPAHTDSESEFECETAPSGPSTPTSRAGRGSFSLMLRSEVPLSDDDELFVDCDAASVSNLDGFKL